MLDLFDYEAQVCDGCGGHPSVTHNKDLIRRVEDVEYVCWDCDAIRAVRAARHAHHDKDNCDCHKRAVWVDKHIPITPKT